MLVGWRGRGGWVGNPPAARRGRGEGRRPSRRGGAGRLRRGAVAVQAAAFSSGGKPSRSGGGGFDAAGACQPRAPSAARRIWANHQRARLERRRGGASIVFPSRSSKLRLNCRCNMMILSLPAILEKGVGQWWSKVRLKFYFNWIMHSYCCPPRRAPAALLRPPRPLDPAPQTGNIQGVWKIAVYPNYA